MYMYLKKYDRRIKMSMQSTKNIITIQRIKQKDQLY